MRAVIDKATGAVIGLIGRLPARYRLPDGATVDFSAPGGLETEAYRCVPVEDAAPPDPRTHMRSGGPVQVVSDGVVSRTWTIVERPLEEVRAEALERVYAARCRQLAFVTVGKDPTPESLAVAISYVIKTTCAMNVVRSESAEEPIKSELAAFGTFISAEAAAYGQSETQFAQTVLAMAEPAWVKMDAVAGAYRLAQTAIAGAPTVQAVVDAEDAGLAAIEAVT